MNPLVSMIIPAYNAEKTIERCIHSVINQTYQNIEVIVVDDGSIDNTFLLCEKYAELSNFIYHKQENQGVSSARNKGIALSKGEYIVFVDSDDSISEVMIEMYMQHHNQFDFVCSTVNKTQLKEKILLFHHFQDIQLPFQEMLLSGFFTSPVCKLYKKNHITTLFEKDISYGEDLLFNLMYLQSVDSVCFINENYYIYDLTEAGLTNRLHQDEFETILRLHREFQLFSSLKLKDEGSKTLITNFFTNYFVSFFQKAIFQNKLKISTLKPYLKNKEYQFILKNSTNSSLNMKILKTNSAFLIASFFKCKQLVKFVLARGKNV